MEKRQPFSYIRAMHRWLYRFARLPGTRMALLVTMRDGHECYYRGLNLNTGRPAGITEWLAVH